MIRATLAAGLALAFIPTARAAEQIVTLGDSLTFAYEAEFGFRVKILNPSTFSLETHGDGFDTYRPGKVRNWIETLNHATYRHDWFDIGTRRTFTIPLVSGTFLLRHEYNWAIPGARAADLHDFISGNKSFTDIANSSDSGDSGLSVGEAMVLAGIDDSDFSLTELRTQVQSQAERLTYFVGGNDMRGVYGGIYNATLTPAEIEAFVSGFVSDSTAVIDQVQTWNPGIPIVIVAVPHIGITPEIRGKYPTDPVKTGYVTDVTRDLNQRLKSLADSRGLGFADIFGPTLGLLDGTAPFTIHGIPFTNAGSVTGDLDYVWLNGEFSANFHPNTNAQAVIANVIIHAFNTTYGDEIPLLTASEMLGGLLGKSAAQIDMSFANWMTGFQLTGLGESDDSDGDGIPAVVEFALGLDPTYPDSDFVSLESTGSGYELRYPIRLPSTTEVTVDAETGLTLDDFTPVTPSPTVAADGYAHAPLPGDNQAFIRLNANTSP
ncbi:SGNH/GDSL hydrolase family protein [Haloferula sargassicola]|uniref:SGNH hydrolase-type esterase domain-containing protein n=1 Tax=Haloferula sargassicola TaxID=490096 RepID=A0ABP9UMB3_9BACT